MSELRDFFISTQPGWEDLLIEELQEVRPWLVGLDGFPWSGVMDLSRENLKVELGGVHLKLPLEIGLQLNFHLRLASRILLRWTSFHCQSFPDLERRLQQLKKDKTIFEGIPFKETPGIKVAAQKSRLNNEKRVLETFCKQWGNQFQKGDEESFLYVRVFDDEFTLSLNTSGKHLHKRGFRTYVAEASLRETLAAWMIRQMIKGYSTVELQKMNFIDPMSGAGTLALEASQIFAPQKMRDFAFQKWNFCPKILRTSAFLSNIKSSSQSFGKLFASDKEESNLELTQKNAELAHIEIEVDSKGQDFFTCEKPEMSAPFMMALNPPYGERLNIAESPNEYFQKIINRCAAWGPIKAVILLPKRAQLKAPANYHLEVIAQTHNGGLDVSLWCLKRI